jgi:hypothetical protein
LEASLAAWREHNAGTTNQIDRFDTASMLKVINMAETRYEYMGRMAEKLGYAPSVKQWRQRNWRLTALKVLVNKAGPGLRMESPMEFNRVHKARSLKDLAGTTLVSLMRALPLSGALPLARHFIKLRYM